MKLVRCSYAGERQLVGIHFGCVVIVDIAWAGCSGRPGNRGVNGVLVGPRGEAACGMDHAVDRVRADEVPGVNSLAAVKRIALQLVGIDR